MANLVAFLDLPYGKLFNTSSIPVIERELGNLLQEAATIKMKASMEEEVRLTLEEGWKNGTKTRRKERMLVPSLSPMS
eukprot:3789322-Ditylum_brightwellii.AAC.1